MTPHRTIGPWPRLVGSIVCLTALTAAVITPARAGETGRAVAVSHGYQVFTQSQNQ
ncbi:hypothetical protein [Streptomyces tsukubensis]|uniref:hypothetical protein n=1 Tax=Streptomyces tsukubensis TaxID=83656 RepID=UPI00344CBE6B